MSNIIKPFLSLKRHDLNYVIHFVHYKYLIVRQIINLAFICSAFIFSSFRFKLMKDTGIHTNVLSNMDKIQRQNKSIAKPEIKIDISLSFQSEIQQTPAKCLQYFRSKYYRYHPMYFQPCSYSLSIQSQLISGQ